MSKSSNNLKELEKVNIQIDIWIDDEEYQRIRDACVLKNDAKQEIEQYFLNDSPQKDFSGKFLYSEIKINEIEKVEIPGNWEPLLRAKYLRAWIMENGTDKFMELLDDLIIFLQKNLPLKDEIFLQHLYYQELSACGKPGLESLGFAVRAYDLIANKNDKQDNGELYKLWAKLNQGIGYWHSHQRKEAALAFNEIIRGFKPNNNNKYIESLQNDEKDIWKSLLFDQAVLSRAELQEDLQFSYHTLKTLEKLEEERKKERRLIKQALAYRDMGRLDEAKSRLAELLCCNEEKLDFVENTFKQFESWKENLNKRNIINQALGLLFDYYIQEFEDRKAEKDDHDKDDIKSFTEKMIKYKKLVIDSKPERVSYCQQVARYLEWLAKKYKDDKDKQFYREQIKDLYIDFRDIILKIVSDKNNKKNEGDYLDKFGKYEYDRFVNSLEKFYCKVDNDNYKTINENLRKDEINFLEVLNNYEGKNFLLYEFKKLEREQRVERIKNKSNVKACTNKNLKCFCKGAKDYLAFEGILECKGILDSANKETKRGEDIGKLVHYYETGFQSMDANDYQVIMDHENGLFLDHLKFSSKHTNSELEKEKKKSYHFMGLQRWNSQTPAMAFSKGGGYFLYKRDVNGKLIFGIAIDPGFDFIDNLFHMGFTIYDLDFILISHAHLDHMRDFEPIISLLLDIKKRGESKRKKKVHVMMSLGVYSKLEHVITNPTLREYLADTYIVDIDKEINEKAYLYPFKFKIHAEKNIEKYIASVLSKNSNTKYEIEIRPTRAYHNDFSEQSDSFGYIINFREENKEVLSFGYTGDTKWNVDISKIYDLCDVVCIHLGALIESEKKKFRYYNDQEKCEETIERKQHPYLFGLLRFLKDIKTQKSKNKLILISEFGEELKGGIRIDFIRRLNQILPACLPVDIGLNVLLAEKKRTENEESAQDFKIVNKVLCCICGRFFCFKEIGYKHFGYGRDEALFYLCKTCLKSKPDNVIQEKMRKICEFGIPLNKAD